MDVRIGQITTSIRTQGTGAGGEAGDALVDQLAQLVLERHELGRRATADRSLAPEDPAGGLDRDREQR
jgi:hypothetical protein